MSAASSTRVPISVSQRRSNWLDFAGFFLALALFGALGLSYLSLPGIYQDEALDAVPAMRLVLRYEPWPYALLPSSLALPLMVSDHVGPTSTYLMLPFLKTLSLNLLALRAYEFTLGLLALIFIFLWARRVTPGTAWVAALLLATMPSLWLAARNGLHVSLVIVPLAAAALLCAERWNRERRVVWLYACCFLLGVGLSTKILFLWFLLAAAAGLALTRPNTFRQVSRGQAAWAGLFFALGCAPFILFTILSRGLIIRTIMASAAVTPYGVKNTAFLENLWTQLHSLARILDGGWLSWAGEAPRNPLAIITFAVAAAYGLIVGRSSVRFQFSLIVIGLMVLASCFTISTLDPKHLVLLLPFLPVVVAWALGQAWSARSRLSGRIGLIVLALLCSGQFLWQLRNDNRYLHALTVTGGTGLFSSAHNELARYLMGQDIREPLAGDWGFDANLEFLSEGYIRVKQIFDLAEVAPYNHTRKQVQAALTRPRSVFLFHADNIATAPGRRAAFLDEVEKAGAEMEKALVLRDGRGEPVIYIYEYRQNK